MRGPRFPQLVESYSGFAYPDHNYNVLIGNPGQCYFFQDGIPLWDWSVAGAIDLHYLGLAHI